MEEKKPLEVLYHSTRAVFEKQISDRPWDKGEYVWKFYMGVPGERAGR